MAHSTSSQSVDSLQECLTLANDLANHPQAEEAFSQLHQQLAADHPLAAQLLSMVWKEMLAARRSATFWQQISDVEKGLNDRMAANHLQLRQNYLRLMQEQ